MTITAQDYLQSVLTSMQDVMRRMEQLSEAGQAIPEEFTNAIKQLDSDAGELLELLP